MKPVVGALLVFAVLAWLGRVSFSALDAVTGFSPAAGLAAAIVAARWKARRLFAPLFALVSMLVAIAAGSAPVHALAFGTGMLVEVLVAAAVMVRLADPLERPETSAWWVQWTGAVAAGVFSGAIAFLAIDQPSGSLMALGSTWVVGHGAGLILVAPGVWAAMRWSVTGGWRHRLDLRHMVEALLAVSCSLVLTMALVAWLDRPEPYLMPFLVLGWLAHSAGHRVTVMASSLVSTATLLAVPLWIDVPAGATPVAATTAIVFGHAAASALAIEASARWHARALLSGVVEISSEAVLIVDGEGRVMTGNPSARALFGAELEGAAVADLIPGLPEGWTSAMPSGLTVEGRGLGRRSVSLEVSVGAVDAPGRPMLAIVCRDMTEIKAAAAALRRSAEIIDAAPDLVGWTDGSGNLLFLNHAGREMIGAAESETIDAWSAAGLLTRDAIDSATRNGVWRGESQVIGRTGTKLPVLQTVVAHRSEDGSIRYFSVLARDISERYALEQMKSEFVSNITHELRSPLTAVIGYLDLLLDGTFGELPEAAMDALGDVAGSAQQLLELINDLLALWRAEDRGVGDPEDLDLGTVVASAVRTMEPVAAGKQIAISFTSQDVLTVGDRRQLERAFLNLVSNAVKFTPVGGTVSIKVEARSSTGVVEISDSGVGIPESELEAVFDRFFRASTAESANIPGTGLGLPLVREVIGAHDGAIRVTSTVGVGTTFSIELPMLVRAGVARV